MSRRHSAPKRKIQPDAKYKSQFITQIINKVMLHGKKSLATKIVYDAIEEFADKVGMSESPLEALDQCFENIKPKLEVKSKRIGGATYQVPIEVIPARANSLAIKWVVEFSRKKSGKSMCKALATEFIDSYKAQGTSFKKKEEVHRMAEANRAFAHFKF